MNLEKYISEAISRGRTSTRYTAIQDLHFGMETIEFWDKLVEIGVPDSTEDAKIAKVRKDILDHKGILVRKYLTCIYLFIGSSDHYYFINNYLEHDPREVNYISRNDRGAFPKEIGDKALESLKKDLEDLLKSGEINEAISSGRTGSGNLAKPALDKSMEFGYFIDLLKENGFVEVKNVEFGGTAKRYDLDYQGHYVYVRIMNDKDVFRGRCYSLTFKTVKGNTVFQGFTNIVSGRPITDELVRLSNFITEAISSGRGHSRKTVYPDKRIGKDAKSDIIEFLEDKGFKQISLLGTGWQLSKLGELAKKNGGYIYATDSFPTGTVIVFASPSSNKVYRIDTSKDNEDTDDVMDPNGPLTKWWRDGHGTMASPTTIGFPSLESFWEDVEKEFGW